MVYLVKNGDGVKAYFGEEGIPEGVTPDMEIGEKEYYAAHGITRVINGEIVLGITPEEKAEDERQMRETEYKAELAEIDRKAGAGRAVRALARKEGARAGMSTDKDNPNYDRDFEELSKLEDRAETLRNAMDSEGDANGAG